jgi:hypothetical protein
MKCEYCGNHLNYEVEHCPNCGAPCEYIVRPQEQKISVKKSSPGNKELRRMSEVDISFLKKNQAACKSGHSGGCGGVLIFILLVGVGAAVMFFL